MIPFLLCCSWFVAVVNAEFSQDCLDAHNKYRRKHHVPEMELDGDMNGGAQTWADELSSSGKFKHSKPSDRPNAGENLYFSGGKRLRAKSAVDAWYNEIKDYSFTKPKFSSKTGHFTQLVWKNSLKLGCAFSQKGRKIFVVARYSPPGNVQGQYKSNVLESGSYMKSPFCLLIIINLVLSLGIFCKFNVSIVIF